MEDLVKSLTPVIHFHGMESYFPESLDYYISQSSLYEGNKLITNSVTPEQLADEFNKESYSLKSETINGSIDRAVLYVRVQDLGVIWRIVFFIFFSFNGVLGCCFGSHRADVERFAFYVDKNNFQIQKIYLGAHGDKDGLWLTPDDFEKEDGRLVIYCALHSHAFYNRAQVYWRYFGFANDRTSRGVTWVNQPLIFLTEESPIWQKFKGNLGHPDNCNTPRYRNWEEEPPTSTTFLKRFFGCC